MGTNKRYAESLQRKRFNKASEALALVPRSLNSDERGDDVRRGAPVSMRAWVTFGDASVQVLGTAIEWTGRAVMVFWTGGDGERREA